MTKRLGELADMHRAAKPRPGGASHSPNEGRMSRSVDVALSEVERPDVDAIHPAGDHTPDGSRHGLFAFADLARPAVVAPDNRDRGCAAITQPAVLSEFGDAVELASRVPAQRITRRRNDRVADAEHKRLPASNTAALADVEAAGGILEAPRHLAIASNTMPVVLAG